MLAGWERLCQIFKIYFCGNPRLKAIKFTSLAYLADLAWVGLRFSYANQQEDSVTFKPRISINIYSEHLMHAVSLGKGLVENTVPFKKNLFLPIHEVK